jgi:hypothetical protein
MSAKYRHFFSSSIAIIVLFAIIKLLIHAFSIEYGYHRDELFYITVSDNLGSANLSMLPLTPAILAVIRLVAGSSLKAIHFFPALCGAFVVALTGLMTRELGGEKRAVALASLAAIIPIGFLGVDSLFTYDFLDKLFWVTNIYLLVIILKRGDLRLWLLFGLIGGLGVLNKISILFLCMGITVALCISPQRKYVFTKWYLLSKVIVIVFLIPFLYWQHVQGWPIVSFAQYYSGGKTYAVSPLEFTWFQIFVMHPFTLPIWISGLYFAFFSSKGKKYRAIAWLYLLLFAVFVILKAKFYFLIPMYPFLFASGSVMVDGYFKRRGWKILPALVFPVMIIGGIITAPIAMPLLPVETFTETYKLLGADAGVKQERHEISNLPQHFADRFGWQEMAMTIAGVYADLPEDEKSKACILTGNYGEAGAVDFFGKEYGLPEPISGHGWHYYEGIKNNTSEVVISIGISKEYLQARFGEVVQAAVFKCKYCMPYENNLPVFVSRKPNRSLEEILEEIKHFG